MFIRIICMRAEAYFRSRCRGIAIDQTDGASSAETVSCVTGIDNEAVSGQQQRCHCKLLTNNSAPSEAPIHTRPLPPADQSSPSREQEQQPQDCGSASRSLSGAERCQQLHPVEALHRCVRHDWPGLRGPRSGDQQRNAKEAIEYRIADGRTHRVACCGRVRDSDREGDGEPVPSKRRERCFSARRCYTS